MAPKLSIIIPLYNKEEYVERCISSVIAQDFTDYELIIVNDGSTDKSAEIAARKFSEKRIHLINTSNRGVSVARNIGLKEAKGEFLIFIDADDYISPNYLSNIINISHQYEADLYVWGMTKEVSKDEAKVIVPKAKGMFQHDEFIHEMINEQYEANRGIMGYVWNKMMKRTIIETHKIRFSPFMASMEDYDFNLQYYRHIENAYFFDESGYHYSWHPVKSPEKGIDYASLIDTHRRCMLQINKLSPYSGSDYRKILETVGRLSQDMFLEMRPITMANVAKHLSEIDRRPYCKKALGILDTNKPTLCKWIVNGRKRSIWLYLKLWNLYLKIRRYLS